MASSLPDLPDEAEAEEPESEWQEVRDPATGRSYFVNFRTKQTAWVKPAEPSAEEAEPESEPLSTEK